MPPEVGNRSGVDFLVDRGVLLQSFSKSLSRIIMSFTGEGLGVGLGVGDLLQELVYPQGDDHPLHSSRGYIFLLGLSDRGG